MILKNVAVPQSLAGAMLDGTASGGCLHGDLILGTDGPNRLQPGDPNATTGLVLPRLTEAHCHLDKCHTIDRLGPVAGDLSQAIAAQRKDRANWTRDDLTARMSQGVHEAEAAGCGALRSHIDWGDAPEPPLSWHVLGDLQPDTGLQIQRAALQGVDRYADTDYCGTVARHVAQSKGGVLGAFVLNHENRQSGLDAFFAQAIHHGLPLDFHVDETLEDTDGLPLIADTALRFGFEGPILCGHACNLMNLAEDAFKRLAEKLARANIFICALPTTNLYLQSRGSGTPDRRGITRLRELHAADVPILLGSDNVGDAFCPTGQHDPLAALHLGVLAAHLDPPFDQWMPAITTTARRAMGLTDQTVAQARASDLAVWPTSSLATLIAGRGGQATAVQDWIKSTNLQNTP